MVLPSVAKEDVQAYWDLPVFAEYNEVGNRQSGRKDSRSSRKDSDNSGNELPLDPESREESRRGEFVEVWAPLRTVPTIVTAHIFCTCQGSRATRKKCATSRTRGLVLSPVSLGGSSYFLWKRCVVFQQIKNNFYLPCQFFENRRSICECCYFYG